MKFCVAIIVVVLSSVTAHAQWITKNVVSGQPLMLGFLYSTNPDCTARGFPTVRVVQAPQNGRVAIAKTRDFPSFHPLNERSDCNDRRVPGMSMRYVSNRGYLGTDSVTLEAIWPSGMMKQRTFSIQVR
jgi:hypothetical protein